MLKRMGYVMASVLVMVVLLFTAVELVTFNMNHYRASYQRYGVVEDTGMDMANLEHVTREMLEYMRGRADELNPRAVVDGTEIYVFGEREREHMVDVKNLFVAGRWLRNLSLIILVLAAAVIIRLNRKWPRLILGAMLGTFFLSASIGIVLVVLMALDFTQAFDWFHYLLFDNDLWQLDPESLMILMLPEVFFQYTALKILAIFMGFLSALTAVAYAIARYRV